MTPNSPQAAQVKAQVEQLIESASNLKFDILHTLYHDDMNIYMFDGENTLHVSDKAGFIAHVTATQQASEKPSTWAQFHLVEADAARGHVLISRKVNLTGELQIVTLSIDFTFEDGRWQITREVIFTPRTS